MTAYDKVVAVTEAMGWRLTGATWQTTDGKLVQDVDWQPHCSFDQLRVIENWLIASDKTDRYVEILLRGFGCPPCCPASASCIVARRSPAHWLLLAPLEQRWAAVCELLLPA